MKTIFMSVVMVALGVSSMASAATTAEPVQAVKAHSDFSFYINGHTSWGNEVYYSCGSIESMTEQLLTQLGATNVSVSCSGGIDEPIPSIMPSVWVKFDSPRMPSATLTGAKISAAWTDVRFHDFDNCYLVDQILDGIKDHLELRGLKNTKSCSNPSDSYDFETSVLKSK